jgi:murein DD-endopeptidase MepM/ murein hydrolase activator NlpD
VIPKDKPDSSRSYSPSYKALAGVAMLILFFGGGWASLSPGGGIEAGMGRTGMELAKMAAGLSREAIARMSAEEAAAAAAELVEAARLALSDPRDSLAAALPEAREILGMLALDRDIDDYLEYAERKDAGGAYYRDQARVSLEMRPLRSRYEAVFAALSSALSGAAGTPLESRLGAKGSKPPYIASPSDAWLPPRNELPLSHPYALDVFFMRVERSGEAERGPIIRALYPGLVVAASADWSGGQGISTWKSGGLSPAAGNGLVIYDPSTRRYISYFHLSSLSLRRGDLVNAGAVLGRGGNSGMNARVKGHGEHVHVEIFDSARGESLTSAEILDLLKR